MEEQIKEMAEKLAKSFEEQENLKEFKQLVKEIGREGVESVIKSLPEESQAEFAEALKKAMEVNNEDTEVGPESKQQVSEDAVGNKKKTKKQQEKSKGEELIEDEDEASKINHQGDNSELPGQVIKSENVVANVETGEVLSTEDVTEELEKGGKGSGRKKYGIYALNNYFDTLHMGHHGEFDSKEAAEKYIKDKPHYFDESTHVKENEKKEVKKGAMKELAQEEDSQIEELEKGELLEKMIEKLRKRGMDHDVVMAALKKKGYDTEMAKSKWEAQQKAEEEMAKEAKKEEVKKSVSWASPNERLEVNAKRGHNAHYDVDGYLVKEALVKAAGPKKEEVLEKSEDSEVKDINDVIAKGYDLSETQIKQATGIIQKSKEVGKYTTSSFSDEDLAKSMGMTVEEMCEVLGYPKSQAQETMNKSEMASEQKTLEKGGEGSKGGKVIGHTKTGKPIYASSHDSHKNWTTQDHADAADLHDKLADKHEKSSIDKPTHIYEKHNELAEHHARHTNYHDFKAKANENMASEYKKEIKQYRDPHSLKKSIEEHLAEVEELLK